MSDVRKPGTSMQYDRLPELDFRADHILLKIINTLLLILSETAFPGNDIRIHVSWIGLD